MSERFQNPNRQTATRAGEEPRINLWRLPRLLSVAARRVSHAQPKVYYVGRERRETREVVELRVETSEPLPVRAVTPILVIGETAIGDYSTEGATVYRFVAYEPEHLEPGASIRWGWPNRPEALVATPFRFSLSSASGAVASSGSHRRFEVTTANTGVRLGNTGFREDLAEETRQPRFRTVFYDEDTLRYLDGWTRATGLSAVFLINRARYDTIRADGHRRSQDLNQFLRMSVGQRRTDAQPPLFVIDSALATVPLNRASQGDWDDLMISQLVDAGRRLRIQSEADQWTLINRLFAKARDDARRAAQAQRVALEFVAYLVLERVNSTLAMVEATNVTMRNGHAVIPLGQILGTDQRFMPGSTDAGARVIGDIHTHYLLDPLIDLNRTSVGYTDRATHTSLHSGVSDEVDVVSAQNDHIVVYAVDSKYLHRANPNGTKDDKLPRSGDVLREALRVFGGEPGPHPSDSIIRW